MSDEKKLTEIVKDLVKQNGGWLNVIGRMTGTFDDAIQNLGKGVDCPFPSRHSKGGGVGDFRFSEDLRYEGRAICSCMQDKGVAPIDLLMMDGLGNGDFVKAMIEVKNVLSGTSAHANHVRRTAPTVTRSTGRHSPEVIKARKAKLTRIALGLVPLSHPSALPGREYFRKRGIEVTSDICDVRFHPALEYYSKDKVLLGCFPAIVSAFRDKQGKIVNLHKIYLTNTGEKLDIVPSKLVKKIDSPLNGFKGSSITIARVEGCRTLHVTEGVEKGWAIHLATGEDVKAAYSCSMLRSLYIDNTQYDQVIIWADRDPDRPERERTAGDGQYFAWELYKRLCIEGGFASVGFMLPSEVPTEGQKGRDWEDLIVDELVLDYKRSYRMFALKSFAVRQGVFYSAASLAQSA